MSRTLLIECSPRRPADGVVVPVRLCFKARNRANFLGVQWQPLVIAPPTFEMAIGYDGRSFGNAPVPQVGALNFALTDATRAAAALVWKDAAVTIKQALWPAGAGDAGDGDFATIWTGAADACSAANGTATVTLIDAGQKLRTALLVTKFGSSGVAALDSADAIKDRSTDNVVPRAWGQVLGVEGLLIDRTNNIWLFAGNAATSVQAFYDGGAAFTLGAARASLAALVATTPAAGQVDYVLNAGGLFLARPWDAPTYPFTSDFTAGSTLAGDIASAIVASRSALAFKAGVVAVFNGVQSAACGLYFDDAATTTAAALDQLFAGLGAFWKVTAAGTIDIRRIGHAAPILTVPAHRRGAPERRGVILPTWRRTLGYARNNKVHSDGEIAQILLAGDLTYADGTTIEALKPAQAGADVTAANTAGNSNALGGVAATSVAAAIGAAGTTATWTGVTGAGRPSDNADVTAAALPLMTLPAAPVVKFDYTGTALTGQLPRPLKAYRFLGGVDVSSSTTWSLTTTGCTASIDSSGNISITAVASTGKIVVTSLRNGVTQVDEFPVLKDTAVAPATGSGGSVSVYDTSIGGTTSASYGATQGGPLTIVCGSSGTIILTAPLTYGSSTNGSARGKWQWKISGGSYADGPGGEATASLNCVAGEPDSGYIEIGDTISGTPGSTYELQLLLRRAAGTALMSFAGTATATTA